MRLISFNVNGIRAITGKIKNGEKKGSATNNVIKTLIEEQKPDIICLQEVKTQSQGDLAFLKTNFKYILTNFSKFKKGYSGVALMTNTKPQWVSYDFKMFTEEELGPYSHYEWIDEGRIITAKFENVVVVTVYTPNSQPELARLDDRVEWEAMLRKYLKLLGESAKVPVVLCGDLNCAHNEIDIHNPKGKSKTAGFSTEERAEFQKMIDEGFTDSFRHLNPDTAKYSYFSNFANSRERGIGWRIDYFLVSDSAKDHIKEADCLNDYWGSDHCPVLLDISV
jgi:exodeoxyribonuclease III